MTLQISIIIADNQRQPVLCACNHNDSLLAHKHTCYLCFFSRDTLKSVAAEIWRRLLLFQPQITAWVFVCKQVVHERSIKTVTPLLTVVSVYFKSAVYQWKGSWELGLVKGIWCTGCTAQLLVLNTCEDWKSGISGPEHHVSSLCFKSELLRGKN